MANSSLCILSPGTKSAITAAITTATTTHISAGFLISLSCFRSVFEPIGQKTLRLSAQVHGLAATQYGHESIRNFGKRAWVMNDLEQVVQCPGNGDHQQLRAPGTERCG